MVGRGRYLPGTTVVTCGCAPPPPAFMTNPPLFSSFTLPVCRATAGCPRESADSAGGEEARRHVHQWLPGGAGSRDASDAGAGCLGRDNRAGRRARGFQDPGVRGLRQGGGGAQGKGSRRWMRAVNPVVLPILFPTTAPSNDFWDCLCVCGGQGKGGSSRVQAPDPNHFSRASRVRAKARGDDADAPTRARGRKASGRVSRLFLRMFRGGGGRSHVCCFSSEISSPQTKRCSGVGA